ncbi:MAG: glycosyltransferase family 4 protein [Bacteroidales bacterium]|nr:glycosyltransferase family 4 protein [Bacteroidales bacterium]
MRKEIKYIGFYDLHDTVYKRVSNLAATNKMDYICEAIIEAGYDVCLVSPSWAVTDGKFKWLRKNTKTPKPHKSIIQCPSFITNNKVTRNIKIIFTLLWLFFWLLKNTRKDEKVLMYHVQWLSLPVRWAKSIKGFQLILEVEEIYGDVSAIHPYFYKLENMLLKSADAYLFSTDLLVRKIGHLKPFAIIYGTYKYYSRLAFPPDDGKIHLLYAGVIDTHKAGAFNAIESAKYLSDKYVMHIIGFGNVDLLKNKIEGINKLGGCQVSYDGLLSGEDFIKYCQKCHVGLSTQNMDGEYLNSSFPSKILSYMALGLSVVSCNIECVKKSKIGELLYYYDNDNPKEIAEAIMSIDFNNSKDSTSEIQKLNNEFVQDIKILLK